MQERSLDHLKLKRWPFSIVPSEDSASVWVGRPELKRKLRVMLRTASRVDSSRLMLLWATFGTGKTHTLRHLEGLAKERADLVPLFVVVPKGIRSFVDIYRAVADAAISAGVLVPAGRDLFDRSQGHVQSNVERAVLRIAMYAEEESRVAVSWIRAERVPLRDLKDIGIGARIESSADAVNALNALIELLQRDGNWRVLLLIDEAQDLAEVGARLGECVGGLHKVFDRNTQGLTMLLSFTTGSQATVKKLLGETLFDRCSEVLTLPALEHHEAVELVEGLLKEYTADASSLPWPFTEAAIDEIIKVLDKQYAELTPRDVIKHFDGVLREADLDIEDGEITEIDEKYALAHLSFEQDDAE